MNIPEDRNAAKVDPQGHIRMLEKAIDNLIRQVEDADRGIGNSPAWHIAFSDLKAVRRGELAKGLTKLPTPTYGDWSTAQVAKREAENILRDPDACSLELVALAEEYQRLLFSTPEEMKETAEAFDDVMGRSRMVAADLGCIAYECQAGKGDPPMDCIAPHCPCGEIHRFELFAKLWWSAPSTELLALKKATLIADEAAEEWDKAPSGMRAGKIILALAGRIPGYRKDTDAIHALLK